MVVVTDEKATILMEHLLQNDSRFNDYALINGQPRGEPRGVGGGGLFSLGTYVGMVLWIC